MGLWRSFLPMLSLFFCLSFVNTILDSLKDTLVITAHGGGAFVIPYLTVYAVLPVSVLFLFAFSAASHRMSRAALFNTILVVFMAFFGGFALVLYPNADVLHPHALADQMQQALPQGLAGFVGMLRNWTFTLFFCMAELWGDVCMGLLFWGLANEITNLSDAATLYPLFGLGANLAQALAGLVLKATTCRPSSEFGLALQLSMAAVIVIAGIAIALQQHITNEAEAKRRHHRHRHNSSHPMAMAADGSSASSSSQIDAGAAAAAMAAADAQFDAAEAAARKAKREKQQPSAWESIKVLGRSLEIRCLAVMSLAQGLCNSLMEFAWKCHMRLLYPNPSDFTAFLGDVATWSGVVTGGLMLLSPLLFERWGWRDVAYTTAAEPSFIMIVSNVLQVMWPPGDVATWSGVVTGGLMLLSPLLFERWGWRGVANTTPNMLLWGGSAFFAACITYQHLFGAAVAAGGAAAAGPVSLVLLQVLVMSGALLYVFGKGAKFSLFKPAEEMVYITLDEDGRTRGKAAIDVVGSQTGKSGGSLLQQALLLASAGSITGIMPVMFGVFFLMLRGWRSAVHELSQVRHYSYDSPSSSMEEEEEDAAAAAAAAGSGTLPGRQ
ncbi:hypothetical protein OEZ85_005580 [Tetradesmus obliquus]|uniref:ADP,ATP carrier protein n=1 Tax=Tetradesmus obliquus TaxID=3088 RepID=A0ABY8UDS5_TETOB|nr:hypothetical protein OEZ85_005580 [Tetradesmus obliquus]